MNQPSFDDGPAVPLMVEGHIEAETLKQLFADLAAAARIEAIREKNAPTAYTPMEELTLETSLARLLSGLTRAVQIRYHFADHDWTDTIMAMSGGFRVVRCRHDA